MKKYIYKNKGYLVLAMICSLVSAIFAVRVQFLKGDVLDFALSKNFTQTLHKGSVLALFILLELAFYYLYDRSRGQFVVSSIKQVRKDFFQSLLSKGYPEFLTMNQGEYLAKYTNEMEIIENQYFNTIPMLMEILVKIVLVSISLFILDYRIALITLVLLTTPLYIPKLVEKHLQRAQMDYVVKFEDHLKRINDWLKGFEIIKNFSVEDKVLKRYISSNELAMEKNLKKKQMGYLTRTVSAVLSYVSHFMILAFAAFLVIRGEFTAGQFFISIGMIDQLSYPIISLSYFLQDLVSVRPVNETMIDYIDSEARVDDKDQIALEHIHEIEFSKVGFSYHDDVLLKNLNMKFQRNKRYLLRGQSGSGKTTSMNLLMKYNQASEGMILVDGYPIEKIGNLDKFITIMRQDATLFHDTLRNNLSIYQDIDDQKLLQVLIDVGLNSFAQRSKLDMLIDEDGVNLSGGEKRRISLARSLLRETPVLILDEPLANLDEATARSIETLLLSIEDRLVLMISHQFTESKLAAFDEIYSFGG